MNILEGSDNHWWIIWSWLKMMCWWFIDDIPGIIYWSLSCYHMMIMWLLCDYHVIIIWWSSNDHQIIILWSAEEDLRRIWLSAVDFHMLMWWSWDYCVIIIKWSSNVHLMIISLGDVKMLGCVSTHYSVGTFIAVYSGEVKLVLFWFLGRCQDGLVLVSREMSRWLGFGSLGDVKMVWFRYLGRRLNVCWRTFRWGLL